MLINVLTSYIHYGPILYTMRNTNILQGYQFHDITSAGADADAEQTVATRNFKR